MGKKRYKDSDRNQGRFFCVEPDKVIEPGTFEYAVDHVIDQLYDDDFMSDGLSNEKTGCKAYMPKMLLKVILVSYARGIMGSRPIEEACRTNLILNTLTGGLEPDHSTIAKFVTSLGPRLDEVFADVLMVCDEEELLLGTRFALDGLKLPSNASKEWSGTFDHLRKKRDKLCRKAKVLAKEHKRTDNRLAKGKSVKAGPTAHESLMKAVKKIDGFLKENEPRIGGSGKEVQSNITDNESYKMKTSHGSQQGFNAQALVHDDNQIITHPSIADSGQDGSVIKDLMADADATAEAAGLGKDYYKGKTLLADSNYYSERNLEAAEAVGVDAIIPDNMFRSRDTRFDDREKHKIKDRKKKDLFTVEDFEYKREDDCYICPNGERLKLNARSFTKGINTYRNYRIRRENHACDACDLRKRCLSKNAKRRNLNIPIEGAKPNILQRMRDRIDTPEAQHEYSKRMGIVEPVFGNIRHNKKLNRFNYRTREKVNWQWTLYCLVHNIEKISRYGKSYASAAI